ncbi:low molecular weight protein-tyrosine-phosphatase [Paenibacillus flagellatus]|uniref:protein-tyrosine-phosphatase n=1 Tax=Paenibacillus flagellatus TaxID=2211139 RepID=A0A2V5K7K4_9BACL|nr:low molecular weight protein-tyrosine-phosphatase [Paenibacillus flagellatus]PYI55419.1 phosphotyrosine protein phosphatase [Paenibacillus flagellatus]
MIRVLFVCLGNICRSPMAEAVFRHKVKEAGLDGRIRVDSAGTGDWHVGRPPHEGTRRLLDRKRIDWQGMTARQVTKDDLAEFDYIVAMDGSNLSNLREMAAERGDGSEAKLYRLLDFVPEKKLNDVPDPYYTGNFEEVYDLVDAGCGALLDKIRRESLERG